MGQQQLLLVILVAIIIGLATILGLVLFENFRDDSIKDLIKQDMMEAAGIAQKFYTRPIGLGGGGESFVNITLDIINLDSSNIVTRFTISETAETYFKIEADPIADIDNFTAVVYRNRIEWEE